jgi:TolA-binding protein
MEKTGRLVLVSIVAVALLAPSAGSQARKPSIETVTVDLITLQSLVVEMQRSADTKNAEMKALLQQVVSRFTTIDSSVQKLGESLAAIKTVDDKSSRDLQDARTQLSTIQKSMDGLNQLNLGESLTDLKNQVAALKKQVGDLNTGPALPGAREAFNLPYSDLSQGFYDDAIAGFRDFLNNFPKDERAPLARVSIGDALVAKKQYEPAIVEFDLAIQTWPESDKKCVALYKKGHTHALLKENPKASAAFQEVGKACPGTNEASLASAELKKLPAGARGK